MKIGTIITITTGVTLMFGHSSPLSGNESVRMAAIAGQFYPQDAGQLKREVEGYIAAGKALAAWPRFLIIPHAGFVFSGPVAGKAYATLDRNVTTVIIIGPSHRAWFDGLAVPEENTFETPLGKIPVDQERMKKLLSSPLVRRNSEAHGPEHCIEVQLPFLQVRLNRFSIVPVLTGNIQPEQAAGLLKPLIDERTVIIASTDFSHYKNQDAARRTDDRSIASIMAGVAEGAIDACGELPVRIVMMLAKQVGAKPVLLDARTSFETAPRYGSGDKVVGYASIVYLPAAGTSAVDSDMLQKPAVTAGDGLTPDTRKYLLSLARQSLNAAVRGEKTPVPAAIPAFVREERGCFVTLTVKGELRGCIGYIEPIKPLYLAVIENAKNAALSDPRFPRVTPSELSSIAIEVSVLTKPAPLEFRNSDELLEKLTPGVDGVILQKRHLQSTYLPQVWEHFSGNKLRFLENLSLKAGMPADGWKTATVKRYQADHFSE